MIYGVYLVGRGGLSWVSHPFWGEEPIKDFTGSLLSSLISLSEHVFKGRLKSLERGKKFFMLKHSTKSPKFIATIITDQKSKEERYFLQEIVSQTENFIKQHPGQMRAGYFSSSLVKELEKIVERLYRRYISPSPRKIQNIVQTLYYTLVGMGKEKVSDHLSTLRQHIDQERKKSYKNFQKEYGHINPSNCSRESVLNSFYELDVERMLAHAKKLKETTSDPIDLLIWIITGIYLNRSPSTYFAPSPQSLVSTIKQLEGELPRFEKFFSLAKLEIMAKSSLKRAKELRKFLNDTASSLLEIALQQASPLRELLCILLMGWYPTSLDVPVLSQIQELFGYKSPILDTYLQTLMDAHLITSSNEKDEKKEFSSLIDYTKKISDLKPSALQGKRKKQEKAELFHLTTILAQKVLLLDGVSLNREKTKSLMNMLLKISKYFQAEMEPLPPLPLAAVLPTSLMGNIAHLYLSNITEEADHLKKVIGNHSDLVERLLQQFYNGRLDLLQMVKYLSLTLQQFGEATLLTEERSQNVPDPSLTALNFLKDRHWNELTEDTDLDFLLPLTAACSFLTPYIPLSAARDSFMEKINSILLPLVNFSLDSSADVLLLQGVGNLQSSKISPVASKPNICKILFQSLIDKKDVSPFVQHLLMDTLNGE